MRRSVRVLTSVLFTAAPAITACEQSVPPPHATTSAAGSESPGAGLPALARIELAIPHDHHPEDANRPIAVSSAGDIAYFKSRQPQDHHVTVVDSAGHVIAQLGRPGDGPGELTGSGRLYFVDTVLVSVDLNHARISRFERTGRLIDDRRIGAGQRPLATAGDSLDLLARPNGEDAAILRIPLTRGDGRTLMAPGDEFLAEVTSGNRAAGQDVPAYAAGEVIALGEPRSYTIRLYTPAGELLRQVHRDLPPRRRTPRELERERARLDRLLTRGMRGPSGERLVPPGIAERIDSLPDQVLPHFYQRGLGFDAHGRLWVIGEANDSTFADVFADTTFLGRHMLPCSRHFASVSLNGRWLGLLCEAEDGDFDGELQLYRIVDGHRP